MILLGNAAAAGPFWVAAFGLLGVVLSPLAETLISKLLPRLGKLPGPRIRIVTAALTAVLCCAFALRFGIDPALPAFLVLAVLGIQLARIDISLHLLPNHLVTAFLVAGISFLFVAALGESQWVNLLQAVAGAVILFVTYLILALFTPGAIGMGDVKLAAPVGLYLGYLGWTHLLYGGLLGFVLNGIVTVFVIARNPSQRATEVAHGPSMLAATAGVALLLS